MPLEPLKPLISDKNLKRVIIGSWIVSAAFVAGTCAVAIHFIAKYW